MHWMSQYQIAQAKEVEALQLIAALDGKVEHGHFTDTGSSAGEADLIFFSWRRQRRKQQGYKRRQVKSSVQIIIC